MTPNPLRIFTLLLFFLLALAGCGGGQTTVSNAGVQPLPQAPVTTASPAGNQFSAPQSVVLQTTGGASIYYTTDGSNPSQNSTKYTGAISIVTNTDLKFFAVDSKGNQESVKTEHYTLMLPVSLRISAAGVAQAMSGMQVTLTLPPGVSVGTSGGAVTPGTAAASGVALGSAAILPESMSFDAASRKLVFILYSTIPAGFGVGEFVNVTCLVSGTVPAPAAFSAILEPVDLLGSAMPLAGASFQVIP